MPLVPRPRPFQRLTLAAGVTLAVVATPLAVTPHASASPSGLVVSEVYGGGGNTGAPLRSDFVELQNTSTEPITLDGLSVQYRSSTGSGTGVTPLSGTVPAEAHWLVKEADGANATAAELPTPDTTGTLAMSGTSGIVFLAGTTVAVPPTDDSVVDLVGYGTASSFEGSGPAPTLSNTTAASRSASGADTDDNAADLAAGAPAPEASGSGTPVPPPAPVSRTIAEIQGDGAASPLVGRTVRTRGVVTASYPTGGLRGFTVQTPGTGGRVDLSAHHASDAVFVYLASAAAATYPAIGDHVSVQGTVSEFEGLTELTPGSTGSVTALDAPAAAPRPAAVTWPGAEDRRESLESMLLAPRGRYTVTDNYALNRYAEIGLARGRTPLRQPTDVARPGAAAQAVATRNAARRLALDDGASIDFLPFGGGENQDVPLPYLGRDEPVRVGAPVRFTAPVVLDYRKGAWKLQPTGQVTATNGAAPATFADTRPARPDRVGGNLRIASFNVLNYFPETGADWVADGGTCSFYDDRDGQHVTVNSCNGDGPRGAAERDDLARQQAKIVRAINTLGADVLSLEEIENSAKYAGAARRDDALATLVRALNADLGHRVWAFVPSPQVRPAVADEDVIRTAFIYRTKAARPVGASRILVGDLAFVNAREPLAQVFRPRGRAAQEFLVVVNHFKSKGSGVDDGTGQGSSNPDRVAQADALVRFTASVQRTTGTRSTFLVGDFNAYTREDPMQRLYDAGYTDLGSRLTGESTYLFDGVVGSLDHVLANRAALRTVTGADVWNINSPESVAYEYSRHHYNATDFYATDFYAPNAFRASDHDPLLVGIRTRG